MYERGKRQSRSEYIFGRNFYGENFNVRPQQAKGDNPNRLPVIDPPAAAVVKRMFEIRAQGISPKHIAETFNSEGIKVPSDYLVERLGRPNHWVTNHLWSGVRIKTMLHNPTCLGHLAQMRTTTVSYKNYKTVKKDEADWVIIENTH